MGIISHPLVNRWAAVHIHPRKFKEHIIKYGIGLDTLGSRTHTLHIVAFGKCLEVTVHRCLQTTMQTATATEVVEHTVHIRAAIVIVCSPFCGIVGIYIVGKQIKTDEAVAILAHSAERTALRHSLPILYNPFWLLIDIILGLILLTDTIEIVVKFNHYIWITCLVCHTTGE